MSNQYKKFMNFLVSVCIPTYNGASYLWEALDSVKVQTYPHIEVIISDDASKDETLAIAERFKTEVEFPVKIVSHKPTGIGANWNNAIKHATGEYIKFLFQDDVFAPGCIEEMVDLFSQHSELELVGCKRDFIIEGERLPRIDEWIGKYGNLQAQFEKGEAITFLDSSLFGREDFMRTPNNKIGEPPTVMFRKSIVNEVGLFDQSLKQSLDYVFYYKILKNHSAAIINKPLAKFRIHDQQATNVNSQRKISDSRTYEEILHEEFFPLLHQSHKKR